MMIRLSLPTLLFGAVLPALVAAEGDAAFGSEATIDWAEGRAPAVAPGADYRGFPERFNRYYTDPDWQPSRTVYVSPNGTGNGTSPSQPMAVEPAIEAARPGTLIHFKRGQYEGCFEFTPENDGTYAKPVVLYAARKPDQSIGVSMNCCDTGRLTCFNIEAANYVAIDGFELIGGNYGVRAVGADYPASQHSRGVAVLNSHGHHQERDPFFSGQADWAVWEGNIGHNAGDGDGHGIYISNGSDWNIVRFNELHSNASSDFQINADPFSTCLDDGIAFDDPLCDAYAGTGEGGQGASDYFLVDSNYFHHSEIGPNFTSVRRSIVRNNIFGLNVRHTASFWQETDNPKLGSRENRIAHNLFITTDRHAVQFINNSNRNEFMNNVLLGIQINGNNVTANPDATLMEVDNSVGANVYRKNLYVSGQVVGRTPNAQEFVRQNFSANWYANFPTTLNHNPNAFRPTASAPFLAKAPRLNFAPRDLNNAVRTTPVDLGPLERP